MTREGFEEGEIGEVLLVATHPLRFIPYTVHGVELGIDHGTGGWLPDCENFVGYYTEGFCKWLHDHEIHPQWMGEDPCPECPTLLDSMEQLAEEGFAPTNKMLDFILDEGYPDE